MARGAVGFEGGQEQLEVRLGLLELGSRRRRHSVAGGEEEVLAGLHGEDDGARLILAALEGLAPLSE